MAGYAEDFSKSNNALEAEANGCYPASIVARELRVPIDVVRAAGRDEWHHTSKAYNRVDYYSIERVRDWLATEEGLAALAMAKKGAPPEIFENCTVEWVEWSGSLRKPVATARRAECCTISKKGKTFTIIFVDGTSMIKRVGCNGLRIVQTTGTHRVIA